MPLILEHTDLLFDEVITEEFKGFTFEHPTRLLFMEYSIMQQISGLYAADSAEWYLMMFAMFTATRSTEKWEKREAGVSIFELIKSRFAKLIAAGLSGAAQQKFARFVENVLLKEQEAVQATAPEPEPQIDEGVQSGKAKKSNRKRST
jgi:hypothetical protein